MLGIEEILKAQPQAPGVPKEEERKKDGESAPHDELLRARHANEMIECEIADDRRNSGSRIIDIDRPNEVSLLPLKPEGAGEAIWVH
jgi:hypothetical protein